MKSKKVVINVGRGFPAKGSFLTFDKQNGKETANCWAKPNLHNNAFTLIELLVVVLIIGILAAVALPQYQVAVWKSRYSTIKSTVRALVNAEEVYYLANGNYTTDFRELDIDLPGGASCTTNTCVFDGGECQLSNTTAYSMAVCFVYKGGQPYMAYLQRFKFSQKNPDSRICRAYSRDVSAVDSKICQQEAGRIYTPTEGYYYSMY